MVIVFVVNADFFFLSDGVRDTVSPLVVSRGKTLVGFMEEAAEILVV